MSMIETDYLVVGGGATGMAFADALVGASDADVVIVDRHDRPGGHWNDDYSFVRLHQPSALYGVLSRPLGTDRIDESGINAGFYERATAAELCDYYSRVLDEHLIPSGRVRFFGMHDHLGDDNGEHTLRSLVSGRSTTVRVRKRVVDATSMASSLPSTHTPPFAIADDARVVTPNDLVRLGDALSGFTVLGAGKTSMDTCTWLVDNGADPDSIRWVRPRDSWTNDRAAIQPLSHVALFIAWITHQNEAGAEATDLQDFVHRLEERGVLVRLDPKVEPTFFRGAILCEPERETLRSIENVVRLGKVRSVRGDRLELDEDTLPTAPKHVYVDCTARGLGSRPDKPIFEPGKITLQWVQAGIAPFSAALIGQVEATRDDDADKNRLCPANGFSPEADARNIAHGWATTQRAVREWMSEPDLNDWLENCRLSPLGNAGEYLSEPSTFEALMHTFEMRDQTIDNLERLVAAAP
jgi:hypothetical protein